MNYVQVLKLVDETQPAQHLKVLNSGIYRGPSWDCEGTTTKIDD